MLLFYFLVPAAQQHSVGHPWGIRMWWVYLGPAEYEGGQANIFARKRSAGLSCNAESFPFCIVNFSPNPPMI